MKNSEPFIIFLLILYLFNLVQKRTLKRKKKLSNTHKINPSMSQTNFLILTPTEYRKKLLVSITNDLEFILTIFCNIFSKWLGFRKSIENTV